MTTIHAVERHLEQKNTAALSHALGDKNPLVRRRAAQALGELADPDGVAALDAALRHDKDQYALRWSVEALQRIASEGAIDALAAAAFGERRDVAALAAQALAAIPSPQAEAAHRIREGLQRNDFEGFGALGDEAKGALAAVMNSPQFAGWPSGKRKPVFQAAARLGVLPPETYRRDLIDMGLFVSHLHTVGDLLAGLNHTSAATRAAAADKLGEAGIGWTRWALAMRLKRETRRDGDQSVAVASARALARLGDKRGVRHYQAQLTGSDSRRAGQAARALAEIRTPEALTALFEAALDTPGAAPVHSPSMILLALESARAEAVSALGSFAQSANPRERLLWTQIVGRSRHPETLALLTERCFDTDGEVQRAGLDEIAALNTPEAAKALYDLNGKLPASALASGLAQMTHPEAMAYLREIEPDVIVIHGVALNDDSAPLAGGTAQMVDERPLEDGQGLLDRGAGGLTAISARAQVSPTGEFWLAVLDPGALKAPRLKISAPSRADTASESYMAEISLARGEIYSVKARIDRFVSRLTLDTRIRLSLDHSYPGG